MENPAPTEVKLHQTSRVLEVTYSDGKNFQLPCEYLRVYSPSAEVQGHGPGQETLQLGKEDINIEKLEQVGTYAIKPTFDDGHDSGIFTWDTLYNLGTNYEQNWKRYLKRLEDVGHVRKEPSA